tara:strand:- start:19827 stop:22478 length:2652 start_codon:yes stop_codon:yes gene_type:complete
MANFPGLILTSAGRNLQAKAQIGQKLEFTRVGLGDGAEPSDPEGLTALVNVKQYLSIQSFEALGDGTSKIRAILTNQGLSTGFFVREIGVYAKDPDTLNEVLYSYSNSGAQSDFLPAEGGATLVEQIFDLVTVIGSAQNVTAVIDDYITIATKADVEEIRPYILPEAGLAGQLLRKATNAEGEAEWFDPAEGINVSVHSITERREAVAGQTVFNLRETRTDGLAVYVNGLRLDPAQYTKLNPTQVELATALAAGDVVQFVNNEETGLDELARVSLTGPTLVFEDSTNTYTITDHDVFSTYGVSTDVGTASVSSDTITLTIPMGATASAANLSVTRNGGTSTFQVAVNEQTVAQPELQQPADGATDVVFDPLLTASAFVVYPSGADTHTSTDWQIATDSAFSTIAWQSLADTANLESIQLPSGTLDPLTTYYIRVRYNGSSIGASAWSSTVAITTSAEYVDQPIITAPTDGTVGVATDPNITTSAFTVMGTDTHASTDWQISDLSDFSNIVWQSLADTANLESISVPSGMLALEATYYVRARHIGTNLGDSEWSPVSSFVTRSSVTPQEAFSTTLYSGDGGTQAIKNGIDLAGEGGLVWIKNRTASNSFNLLFDTVRGLGYLRTDTDGGEVGTTDWLSAYRSDGFTVGPNSPNAYYFNRSGDSYASWTFRRAPRFFDIVAYTGDGVAGRQIPHDLGVSPGMIIVKKRSTSGHWPVYHRGVANKWYTLNSVNSGQSDNGGFWGDGVSTHIPPDDSVFTVSAQTGVNASGATYIAYIFAHDITADGIVKCGSYTGNGGSSVISVNIGWEPQWLLVKQSDGSGDWWLLDSERGTFDHFLKPHATDAEDTGAGDLVDVNSNGFEVKTSTNINASGSEYIYMAIRKPII